MCVCGDVFVVVVVIFHVCVFYFYIVIMAGLICFRLLLGWFLCVIFIFFKIHLHKETGSPMPFAGCVVCICSTSRYFTVLLSLSLLAVN